MNKTNRRSNQCLSFTSIVLVFASAFAGGCNVDEKVLSADPPKGGGGGPIEMAASTASEFASSYCEVLKPCCALGGFAVDGKQCRTVFGAIGSKYRADLGKACLDAARAKSSANDFCALTWEDETESCNELFNSPRGNKMPGENCDADNDCATSSKGTVVCQASWSGDFKGPEVRKCQVQIRGKEGDKPCAGTVSKQFFHSSKSADVPEVGYVCHVSDELACSSASQSCTKIPSVGEACRTDQFSCVDGAYCDGKSLKCVLKQPVGSPCSSAISCVDAAYCNTSAKTCAARGAKDAVCETDEQCLSKGCVNAKCDKSFEGLAGLYLAVACGQ